MKVVQLHDFLEKHDRERIANLLTSIPNCTLVTVTDDAVMAAKCDRIIIMQEGRIVEEGSLVRAASRLRRSPPAVTRAPDAHDAHTPMSPEERRLSAILAGALLLTGAWRAR